MNKHHGMPGHFIGSAACCFHLCTDIDDRWRVSTVGCYHPRVLPGERTIRNRVTIGADRLFETMVFQLKDGNCEGDALEMDPYNDEEAAEAGHAAMVEKWVSKKSVN